jgi:predicted RNase H-like nuclease
MERAEVREHLSPPPRPGRWSNYRMVEYQLRQRGINCPRTPATEQDCPNWMRVGFALYSQLKGIGYLPYPQEGGLRWLEIYPHACYCALLGRAPFAKSTLEGRIQRQLILYQQEIDVADPMLFFEEITRYRLLQGILPVDNLRTPEELDALVAAYTAWLTFKHPEQTMLLGDPEEGQIVLPVAELKSRY